MKDCMILVRGIARALEVSRRSWSGRVVSCFLRRVEGFGEGAEAGVAAEFGEGAGDADGAELLEDVGVAGDGGFCGDGCVLRLVGADDFEDGGDFFFGEGRFLEDGWRFFDDVGYVVPGLEGFFGLRGGGR